MEKNNSLTWCTRINMHETWCGVCIAPKLHTTKKRPARTKEHAVVYLFWSGNSDLETSPSSYSLLAQCVLATLIVYLLR